MGIASTGYLVAHQIYKRLERKWNKLPPGPAELPLIGSLWYFILYHDPKDKMASLHRMSSTYGDILYLRIMGISQITISDSELFKKIVTDKRFRDVSNNRWIPMKFSPLFAAKDGEQNFVNLNGEEWVQRRKLFLSVFNKMMTTKWMDKVNGTAIQKELIPEINKCIEENRPFLPKATCKYLSFQSIYYANFNRFAARDDEWFVKLRDEFERAIKFGVEDDMIQWMMYGKGPLDPKYEQCRDNISEIINQLMDQRREELRYSWCRIEKYI